MHESTPLTRHLAAQGLKIKLRTDTTVGRQLVYRINTTVLLLIFMTNCRSVRRRRASPNPTTSLTPPSMKEDLSTSQDFPPVVSTHSLSAKSRLSPSLSSKALPGPPEVLSPSSKVSRRTVSDSPRNLVWRHAAYESVRSRVSGPGKRPFTDDGLPIPPNSVDWRGKFDCS